MSTTKTKTVRRESGLNVTSSNSTIRVRRRQCKFIRSWLFHRQFSSWLKPVRGDNHKAYCVLCDKVFSVAHGGLHDVRAHWKGKRHISLQASLVGSNVSTTGSGNQSQVLARREEGLPACKSTRNHHRQRQRQQQQQQISCTSSHRDHRDRATGKKTAASDRECAQQISDGDQGENSNVKNIQYIKKEQSENRDSNDEDADELKTTDWLAGDFENFAEGEGIDELDRFEFECQRGDWSHLDQFGEYVGDTAGGGGVEEEEADNYGKVDFSSEAAGGEEVVVPSLRMLQQRSILASATSPPATSATTSNMFPQQYCLRWKYHHSNLQTMFSQLLERQAYCDVTLACEGKTLRAHKVVLSACSTYFDTILSQYEEKDPIVIMRDVKFSDIKVLVEFMYKGEINIDHTRLSSLLKTAEDLHIKGLAEVSWRSDPTQNDLTSSGHSPGAATPGVETVLREGDTDEPPPPKQRRRGRPPLDDPPSAHDVFTPKITCITGNEEMMSEGGDHESWDDEMMINDNNEPPLPVLSYMSKDDSISEQEKKASSTPSIPNATNLAIPEQFRDVVKMNDYLTTGRRQEFWEEPFTRRVMDAIKSKELEMKTAAEILGVSYGTLYGRYRDSYGCLKHPYRVRDFWSEPGPAEVLSKLRRKEITLFRAAEFLNVTVHTLATYLSTLQGPDRISLAGDLSVGPGSLDGNNDIENNESVNDILQKINANVASATTPTTSTPIKREGGGYIEIPTTIPKTATSVLENNPDITIVKAESMQRKREYSKVQSTENNNAKLMSGGAVSEVSQQKQSQQPPPPSSQLLSDPLSLNNDSCKP